MRQTRSTPRLAGEHCFRRHSQSTRSQMARTSRHCRCPTPIPYRLDQPEPQRDPRLPRYPPDALQTPRDLKSRRCQRRRTHRYLRDGLLPHPQAQVQPTLPRWSLGRSLLPLGLRKQQTDHRLRRQRPAQSPAYRDRRPLLSVPQNRSRPCFADGRCFPLHWMASPPRTVRTCLRSDSPRRCLSAPSPPEQQRDHPLLPIQRDHFRRAPLRFPQALGCRPQTQQQPLQAHPQAQ